MKSAKENWKIVSCNNNYEVSDLGNIRNRKTKKIMRPAISNKGYYLVSLSNKGKQHTYTIHKLVMENFNRLPLSKEVINHIDHNKLNNKLDNLEYITQKENVRDAFDNNLCSNVVSQAKKNILRAIDSSKIKIDQYDINNNYIKTWDSIRECSRELNIDDASISRCLKGRYKKAGGYIWKYHCGEV